MKNAIHKNAPGAINAIAFIVRPPKPSVAFVVGFLLDGMSFSLIVLKERHCNANKKSLQLAFGRISHGLNGLRGFQSVQSVQSVAIFFTSFGSRWCCSSSPTSC